MKKGSMGFLLLLSLTSIAIFLAIEIFARPESGWLHWLSIASIIIGLTAARICFKKWGERPQIFQIGRFKAALANDVYQADNIAKTGQYDIVIAELQIVKMSSVYVKDLVLAERLRTTSGWREINYPNTFMVWTNMIETISQLEELLE